MRRYYRTPIVAKVFQYREGKMRKEKTYRTNKGLEKYLSLYAQVMPFAQVYVERNGQWYRVSFTNTRNNQGELVEWGYELKESDHAGDAVDTKVRA